MKLRSKILATLATVGASASAVAQGEVTGSYNVPQGVTQAVADAKAAATALANEAIPGVTYIALAFIGLVIVWLLVKSIRRGAK